MLTSINFDNGKSITIFGVSKPNSPHGDISMVVESVKHNGDCWETEEIIIDLKEEEALMLARCIVERVKCEKSLSIRWTESHKDD